jgi:tetratricopeptide (TPR) repeat protein/tRNA A-37 threonylcarbamoyl transferase component Bud32
VTNPDEELLADLLLRWEELQEQGLDTPASEIAPDRPNLVPELDRRIRLLKASSWLDKPIGDDPPDDDDPDSPPTPRTLGGRYRLDELIAEGGFARVYKAYDTELQRTVAVKIPKPDRLESAETLQAEARRIARLDHERIVSVFDAGIDGDTCYIVTEYVAGGSLASHLAGNKPSSGQVVDWIVDVAEALEHAHLNGVIHRDIKPGNILIDRKGRAKLADFGISRSSPRSGPDSLASVGTLWYMSPEQLKDEATDHRGDIYSLAVVLHEALSGRPPYNAWEPLGLRKEILDGTPTIADDIPANFRPVLRRAMSRSPHQRQASATQFAAEIRKAMDKTAGPASWPWIAATAILLAGGAYGVIRSTGETPVMASPRPAHEILAIATTNMLHGHFEDAEKGFTEVIAQDPENIEAVKGRGYCLLNMDRLEAAVADLDRVLASRPDDATTLRRRSKAHALLRDFPRAISDLRRTIELMPTAAELPGELATVYAIRSHERFEAGDYEGSREDMDEVIRLAPDQAVNYSRRGACWFHVGEYEKSLADMDEAIRREPGNPDFYEKRSYALRKLGRNDEAEADEKKARELKQ